MHFISFFLQTAPLNPSAQSRKDVNLEQLFETLEDSIKNFPDNRNELHLRKTRDIDTLVSTIYLYLFTNKCAPRTSISQTRET